MCTNIGATGASVLGGSKVYFGSVSDDPYDIRTRVIVEREAGGYAFVGTDLVPLEADGSAADYRDSVSGAPTRGLNEKGLGFTWALAFERPENTPPDGALKPHDLWRRVMREAASVGDALAILEESPRDMGGLALIADRAGELAQVEIGRRNIEVTDRRTRGAGGAMVNVNCWVSMQAADGVAAYGLDVPTTSNISRYESANARVSAVDGQIDLGAMRDLLCNHEHKEKFPGENTMLAGHGFSVCNHGTLHKPAFDTAEPCWGTVSAEIIDPVDGVFWYAYGWPCGEAPDYGDQMLQERSWGAFLGFPLDALPAGEYTTLTGELTHLAAQHFGQLKHLGPSRRIEPLIEAAE